MNIETAKTIKALVDQIRYTKGYPDYDACIASLLSFMDGYTRAILEAPIKE